jgi:hypothetical protein
MERGQLGQCHYVDDLDHGSGESHSSSAAIAVWTNPSDLKYQDIPASSARSIGQGSGTLWN